MPGPGKEPDKHRSDYGNRMPSHAVPFFLKSFAQFTPGSGHDKGKLYIIMEEEDEYVYLSDGRLRTVDKLKKKKKKHIQIIKKIDERIFLEIENHRQISNEEIKRAIKEYEHRPIQEGENVKSRCY